MATLYRAEEFLRVERFATRTQKHFGLLSLVDKFQYLFCPGPNYPRSPFIKADFVTERLYIVYGHIPVCVQKQKEKRADLRGFDVA